MSRFPLRHAHHRLGVVVTALMLPLLGCEPPFWVESLRCSGPLRPPDCRDPPSAIPADQDALLRWFWVNYEDASDAQMHEALTALHASMGGDGIGANVVGTLTDLSPEDVDHVEVASPDPARATGLVLIGVMDCSMEQVDRITLQDDQRALYPGVYDSYERTYLDSKDEYAAGTRSTLRWNIASSGTLLQSAYRMKYGAGNRRVPAAEGSAATGPFLVTRTWLREPADFDSDSREMRQDYQVEIYYVRSNGQAVHLWSDWRDVRVGMLTNDDSVVLELMVGNMESWDNQTRQLCRENRP